MLEWDQWWSDGGPCPYPDVCYNFLYMPLLCVFCGYREGINLGVHNKAEGNLKIKATLFQFWVQGHFGPVAKWFDFLPLLTHTAYMLNFFHISKRPEYFISIFITLTGAA